MTNAPPKKEALPQRRSSANLTESDSVAFNHSSPDSASVRHSDEFRAPQRRRRREFIALDVLLMIRALRADRSSASISFEQSKLERSDV